MNGMAGETRGTVRLALLANVLVAAAKFVGGAITGSPAMLSEGAHSVADCLNQVFLLTSLRRSERPADAQHPFGHGKERFFWSLLAAVGIFVAGAGFSALEAYRSFTTFEPTHGHYYLINYVVLGVAFVAEGVSWLRAVTQVRAEARAADRRLVRYMRESSDPSVLTVVSEDTAAMVGLVLAAAGLVLHQVTGAGAWEGVASALIAVLLIVVAIALGRNSKDLLIGEAATPEVTEGIRAYLSENPAIDEVLEVLTMHIGPNQLLLAARVDLADDLDSAAVEQASSDIDEEIQRRWPAVTEVFIDATRGRRRGSRIS
jgi:cation diffusion facilitator family transporter